MSKKKGEYCRDTGEVIVDDYNHRGEHTQIVYKCLCTLPKKDKEVGGFMRGHSV